MIFHFDDRTYRFSFKHEVFNGPAGVPLRMSSSQLPKYRQHNGHVRELRGKTYCYIAELGPNDNGQPNVTLLSEGIARCSVSDNYNKERGRQLALRRALEKLWPTNHEPWGLAFKAYSNRQPPKPKTPPGGKDATDRVSEKSVSAAA